MAVLGDFNEHLIHVYRYVQQDPIRLAQTVRDMPLSSSFYYQLRAKNPDQLNDLERASRFVYLNRFCFNGIYRTNRKGQFNVPKGRNTGDIPSANAFVAFSDALRNAKLLACDFEDCLDSVSENDFVYLDPPYAKYAQIDRGEYGYNGFGEKDLSRLIETLRRIDNRGATVILSYAFSDIFLDLIRDGWYMKRFAVRRSIAGFSSRRGFVNEVLICNHKLPPLCTV